MKVSVVCSSWYMRWRNPNLNLNPNPQPQPRNPIPRKAAAKTSEVRHLACLHRGAFVAAVTADVARPSSPSLTTAELVPTKTRKRGKQSIPIRNRRAKGYACRHAPPTRPHFGPLPPSLATEQVDPRNYRESTAENAGLGGACTHAPLPQWHVGRMGDFTGLVFSRFAR